MYLKTFGICLVVGLALGAPKGGSGGDAKQPVPPTKVEEIDCKKMEKELKLDGSFDFCVKIGFPKRRKNPKEPKRVLYGGLTIVADDDGEKYKDVYEGKVIAKDEEKWVPIEETRISMTVKPDVDIATMLINDGDQLFELKVDLRSSEAEPDQLPKDYANTDDEKPFPDEEDRWNDQTLRKRLIKAYRVQKSKPKRVALSIQFVAEQNFVQKYGSEYQVRKRITEVGNHLKTMYSHHSLPVIIDVKILRAKFMDEKVLITGDNRDWFGQEAAKKVKAGIWPKADTYILLGPNNKDGFYGVANGGWELNGGVCSTNVAKKVSINWYETSTYKTRGYSDDLLTALTVVHENGHNLGMRHDFKDIRGKPTRTATMTGKRCKGVQGFMDYVFPPYSSKNKVPELFSDCSGEDWEAHYMQVVENRGKYCLKTTCDNGPCDPTPKETEPEEPEEPEDSCKDLSRSCSRRSQYCSRRTGYWKNYMRKNCKKTCNLLNRDDRGLANTCKRYKSRCTEGKIKYRYRNSSYMFTLDFNKSCKKTCCIV